MDNRQRSVGAGDWQVEELGARAGASAGEQSENLRQIHAGCPAQSTPTRQQSQSPSFSGPKKSILDVLKSPKSGRAMSRKLKELGKDSWVRGTISVPRRLWSPYDVRLVSLKMSIPVGPSGLFLVSRMSWIMSVYRCAQGHRVAICLKTLRRGSRSAGMDP